MDALILTCGTGGGHNSAARAVAEEVTRQGGRAVTLNPYTLCGGHTANWVDKTYISLVQHIPELFGAVYHLGELYRRLPFRSPIYFINKKAARHMADYLAQAHFDIIIATHLFPAEIMTWLKAHGTSVPPVIYVATDYTCIPFTEETDCDAYVIPAKELTTEFVSWGIPKELVYPLGIPVSTAFHSHLSPVEAKRALGLDADKDYLLLSGGSIGAGKLASLVKKLQQLLDDSTRLIVICGNNQTLFRRLRRKYGDSILLLQRTEDIAVYIRASKLYFTKPGGLSSTEAAVISAALVHMPPIPGCETKNLRFFAGHGMSYRLKVSQSCLEQALSLAEDTQARRQMADCQHQVIPQNAAQEICALAQRLSPHLCAHT